MTDIKASEVPPRWPAPLPAGSLPRATYELVTVDASSISLVVNRLLKVNTSGIVDRRAEDPSEKAAHDLAVVHEELGGLGYSSMPEVEWTRIRELQFQELIRQRAVLMDRLAKLGCVLCDEFDQHVSNGRRGES